MKNSEDEMNDNNGAAMSLAALPIFIATTTFMSLA